MKTFFRWVGFLPCMIVVFLVVYAIGTCLCHWILGREAIPFIYNPAWESQTWYRVLACVKECFIEGIVIPISASAMYEVGGRIIPKGRDVMIKVMAIICIVCSCTSMILCIILRDSFTWYDIAQCIISSVALIIVSIVFYNNSN